MKISKDYLTSIIDHTLLKPNAIPKDVEHLCAEAVLHSFGAVCVRPFDVKYVAELLKDTGVNVCTVIGFPWGIQTTATKIKETYEALCNGATEIDMVINRAYLKEKNYSNLEKEIYSVVRAGGLAYSRGITTKVILETCELTDDEIVKACLIAEDAGAHYVKTSTGLYKGATLKAVKLMHKTVPNLGVKASGGIKDWKKAYKMIKAGTNLDLSVPFRLGTSSGIKIVSGYVEQLRKKR